MTLVFKAKRRNVPQLGALTFEQLARLVPSKPKSSSPSRALPPVVRQVLAPPPHQVSLPTSPATAIGSLGGLASLAAKVDPVDVPALPPVPAPIAAAVAIAAGDQNIANQVLGLADADSHTGPVGTFAAPVQIGRLVIGRRVML